ncbi:hypothetical protein [Metallibacterium scheffleri]|nr:hypothetical protein [Metallibacterium scheffleri]
MLHALTTFFLAYVFGLFLFGIGFRLIPRSTGFVLLCIALSVLAIAIHGMPSSIASHRASGAIADGFLLLSFAMSLAGIWQSARHSRKRSR